MIHVDDPRSRAYLEILAWSLLRIRAAGYDGDAAVCAIEAEHVHNIPSLIGEPNEQRHEYYIEAERGLYLKRLRDLGGGENRRQPRRFDEPWSVLASIAGVELADVEP